MALMKCPECGREISDKAKNCPSCGVKIVSKKRRLKIGIISVILVIALGFVILLRAGNWNLSDSYKIISSGSVRCLVVHEWEEPTCEHGRLCSACGIEQGDPIAHEWIEATCTMPKTCEICGKTEGKELGHLTKIGYCSRCGEYSTELLNVYEVIDGYCNSILALMDKSITCLGNVKQGNQNSYVVESNNYNLTINDMYKCAIIACSDYDEFSGIKENLIRAKAKLYLFDEILDTDFGAYMYVNAISQSLADSLNSLEDAFAGLNELRE